MGLPLIEDDEETARCAAHRHEGEVRGFAERRTAIAVGTAAPGGGAAREPRPVEPREEAAG